MNNSSRSCFDVKCESGNFEASFRHSADLSVFSEYYFSQENLEADMYLRQQMTKEGHVPLSLIASFNRVQSLCADLHLIAEVKCDP